MRTKIVGIQGGQGSYNEVAIIQYMKSRTDLLLEVKYLYSTKNVFNALDQKIIDVGQFAISNSVGGYVEESLTSIADFLSHGNSINVIATYDIPIAHCLMIHPSSTVSDIKKVISHPQALKQCKKHLCQQYGNLELIEGEDEYSDPAKVAEGISSGQFGRDTATLSNPSIAEIYGLKVINGELQDSNSNRTKFILVGNDDKT